MKKQFLLILFALCFPWSAWAQVEIDGINYVFDDENRTATVVSGETAYTGAITIPEVITYESKYYTVTGIGEKAFQGCSGLTSIDIPESVTTIGDYAFDGCSNMTSVDIPFPWSDLSNIGSYAFRGCTSLTSVSIPESVRTIGDYAFDGCDNLVYVYTYYSYYTDVPVINSSTFSNRANATLHNYFYYYSEDLGHFWDGFGNYEFEYVGGAFNWKLIDMYTEYDYDFVSATQEGDFLSYINLDDGTCQVGAKFVDICEYKATEIPIYAPRRVKSKVEKKISVFLPVNFITIPSEVNGIKVTRIGEEAFSHDYSSSLLAVYIPESIREIAGGIYNRKYKEYYYGFYDEVTINEGEENCSAGAFDNCSNLTTVVVGMKTPISIENNVFSSYSDATLYVPEGSKEAYENAENWNKFGNIVEYDPEEPINLEYLTNVDYRLVEVDGIGYNLYTDGTAEVANALRVLYEEGGGWNEKRSEVFLDEDWKDWESFNWDGSEFGWEEFSVTDTIFIYSGNIVIPDSLNFKGHTYTVTTINSNAFRGSKDMTSITIPSTITSIGKNAFNTCI